MLLELTYRRNWPGFDVITFSLAGISEQGKVSLLSRKGVRELQYLIFVLAFFHSLSCVLTFSLGMAKVKKKLCVWQFLCSNPTISEYFLFSFDAF